MSPPSAHLPLNRDPSVAPLLLAFSPVLDSTASEEPQGDQHVPIHPTCCSDFLFFELPTDPPVPPPFSAVNRLSAAADGRRSVQFSGWRGGLACFFYQPLTEKCVRILIWNEANCRCLIQNMASLGGPKLSVEMCLLLHHITSRQWVGTERQHWELRILYPVF